MDEDLFDQLPDLIFESVRKKMLLGLLPYDTVETILDPLLRLLDEDPSAMERLPADLRMDIENILRIYRQIAVEHNLKLPPTVVSILSDLEREWNKAFEDLISRRTVMADSRFVGPEAGKAGGRSSCVS